MKTKKIISTVLTAIIIIAAAFSYKPYAYADNTPIIKDCYPSKAMVFI